MQDLRFPLTFHFKITTLANDFSVEDASGRTVAYVRQKMLRLREHIEVFSDDSRNRVLYEINADRWLDWSAAYAFTDPKGRRIGKVARKGWASLWKAEYEIIDDQDKGRYNIREENGWVKVIDSLVGEIPVVGALTGYIFNPSYIVTDTRGSEVVRLTKEPSFWGRRFRVEKLNAFQDPDMDDERIMLGLMMMVLLERRRG